MSTGLKLHKLYIVKTTNQWDHTQTEVGPQTGVLYTPTILTWIAIMQKMCTPTKHLQMPLVTACSCLMWQCLQFSCWCNDTLIVGKQPSSMTTHRFYSFPVTSCVHFVHNSCPSISQRKLQNCPWDDSTTPKPQQENKRWEGISWDVTCPSSSIKSSITILWPIRKKTIPRLHGMTFFISQHREMTG